MPDSLFLNLEPMICQFDRAPEVVVSQTDDKTQEPEHGYHAKAALFRQYFSVVLVEEHRIFPSAIRAILRCCYLQADPYRQLFLSSGIPILRHPYPQVSLFSGIPILRFGENINEFHSTFPAWRHPEYLHQNKDKTRSSEQPMPGRKVDINTVFHFEKDAANYQWGIILC
ncbi:Hypothetical predicted protein [Paramuricea clavata]|uniref:Uncharacterized protein n=1 Tax=Paramuricea clavata TaxID=317549 RepID=A0A6S7H1L6_PARCT|nr:Hypothetical predicted protein [Paramuricea clavata]